MNETLRNYINSLFEGEAQTKKMVELKEEMLQNLTDKYNDLLAEGKSEDAAYNIAVASIGDVSGLIEQLKEHSTSSAVDIGEKQRRKSALLTAIAIMGYILCVVPAIILPGDMGPALMFIIVAAATGLLIYNNMTKPKYTKVDDTVVEEFREWKATNSNKKQVFKAVTSALWSITLAVYFIISFITGAWYITWVIFLISSALNAVLKAIFDLSE